MCDRIRGCEKPPTRASAGDCSPTRRRVKRTSQEHLSRDSRKNGRVDHKDRPAPDRTPRLEQRHARQAIKVGDGIHSSSSLRRNCSGRQGGHGHDIRAFACRLIRATRRHLARNVTIHEYRMLSEPLRSTLQAVTTPHVPVTIPSSAAYGRNNQGGFIIGGSTERRGGRDVL